MSAALVLRRLVVCCAAVGAVAAVAGCSAEEPAKPQPERERPAVDVPRDRDEGAVVDGLRRVDLCAVLEAGVGGGRLSAARPSACSVTARGGGVEVEVHLLGSADRLRLPTRDLGGAKAYVDASVGQCTISLPVSFELAIQFRQDTSCDAVEPVVADAAAALADPGLVGADPRWEACEVLRAVSGTDVDHVDTMDSCVDKKSLAVLELTYGDPGTFPADGWQRTTIDGVEVATLDDRDPDAPSCTAEWRVGREVTTHADGDLRAQLRAYDCDKVTSLLEPVLATLKQRPGDGRPRHPLLYAPDEPDRPFAGACAYADLPENADCAPYVETALPDDLTAAADPDVYCAVARDSVAKEFGAGMRAVTAHDDCYFVSPERLVQVTVALWEEPAHGFVAGDPRARQVMIGGHPGFVLPRVDARPYEVWLATTTSVDKPGALRVTLAPGPVAGGRLTDEAVARVAPVLADIVRAHFS
ncbi:hypothetical protein [Actinophytocola sp.]|uniref:hypothetical protein n=1 Tax=Actinophytocola sp. TaxID=1872138 RepID=UPI002EDAA5FA